MSRASLGAVAGWRRWVHVALALALAVTVVVPVLPADWMGGLPRRMAGWMRKISVQQYWGMYAPYPSTSHTYMILTAHWPDGTTEPLPEAAEAEAGWGTTWLLRKDRTAIWRHYANAKPKGPNRNRDWYLRGVCVREARRRGQIPDKIVMEQVTRRFAPPNAVRSGKLALGRPRRRQVAVQSCRQRSVRAMIDADPFRSHTS